MYKFPWYLTLVSTNYASSIPGQKIINIEVMMLMNVIGESVKFFGKEVYLGKLYKSSRSYENRVNKHVVISLNFPCLIASLPSCLLMSFFLFVLWLGFV